jgi:hypothetical protein
MTTPTPTPDGDTPGVSTATGPIKRPPSGAAVPGAHPRPKKYPHQLILMVSDETWARVQRDADEHVMSKSEVGRTYLEAGIVATDEAVRNATR